MTVQMADIFRSLGFEPADDPFKGGDAFTLTVGSTKLNVVQRINRSLQKVFVLTGALHTGRTSEDIVIELPVDVPRRDDGLALIGYSLGTKWPEDIKPDWLKHAEALSDYLPWSPHRPAMPGEYSSGPLVRERYSHVSIYVDLDIKEDGSVTMSGQDIGQAQESCFGKDYEYWVRLKPDALSALVGCLLREKYAGNASAVSEFRAFCEDNAIDHEFGSW